MFAVLAVMFAASTILNEPVIAQGKAEQEKAVCYLMKKGKVVEVKNSKETPLKADVTLKNGTVVMPNGSCKMKDGKTTLLKEGECMHEDGKIGTHADHQKKKNH